MLNSTKRGPPLLSVLNLKLLIMIAYAVLCFVTVIYWFRLYGWVLRVKALFRSYSRYGPTLLLLMACG